MSNSQCLLFYSKQRHITLHGSATYWNSSGYIVYDHEARKYRVKVLSKGTLLSQGQFNDQRSQITLYKRQILFGYLEISRI